MAESPRKKPWKPKVQVNQKAVRELHGFCRYLIKEHQISQIRQKLEKELDPEYLTSKFRVNRWRDFKERRLDLVKHYIGTKRKLQLSTLVVIHVKMCQVLRKLANFTAEIKQ